MENAAKRWADQTAKKAQAALLPFMAGAFQGMTHDFGDEIARAAGDKGESMAALRERNVRAFEAGRFLGGAATTGAIGGAAVRMAESPVRAGIALGALHGAGFGLGAGVGPATLEERGIGALTGAASGAAVAGLAIPAGRAVGQAIRNAPTLVGRPRIGAPTYTVLAGQGTAAERAAEAVSRARALDAAASPVPLNARARAVRPIDVGGADTQALRAVAMRSPGGRQAYTQSVTQRFDAKVKSLLSPLRLPAARGSGDPTLRAAFEEAMDDPVQHTAWVKQARLLPAADRRALAERLLDEVRGASDPFRAYDRMTNPQWYEKLRALGVSTGTGTRSRAPRMLARDQREMAAARADLSNVPAVNFSRGALDEQAAAGPLAPDDAAALIEALYRPRPEIYVRPATGVEPMFLPRREMGAAWNNPFSPRSSDVNTIPLALAASAPVGMMAEGAARNALADYLLAQR